MRSLLFLCLGMALLTGCGGSDQSTLERIKDEGVLRIAYANEPPYGYLDNATGRVTGEAPEIARHVAQELGIEEVEGVLTDWDGLINGLRSGRFDCVAAGMYITPERAEAALFSDPTYVIGEAFMVEEGNPKNLHSYQDVLDSDLKLGVVSGTVEVGYAEKLGIPGDQVVVFDSNLDAVDGVRTGRVDAFAGTSLTIDDLLKKLDEGVGLEKADPFTDPVIDGQVQRGYGAFAFRKGDEDLRDAFNEALDEFIGSEEHLQLVAPFGFGRAQLPGDVTAEDVIQGITGN